MFDCLCLRCQYWWRLICLVASSFVVNGRTSVEEVAAMFHNKYALNALAELELSIDEKILQYGMLMSSLYKEFNGVVKVVCRVAYAGENWSGCRKDRLSCANSSIPTRAVLVLRVNFLHVVFQNSVASFVIKFYLVLWIMDVMLWWSCAVYDNHVS